jgi:hypothetical protein
MAPSTEEFIRRYKWHIVIVVAAVSAVLAISVFTETFRSAQAFSIPASIWPLAVFILLVVVLLILGRTGKALNTLNESDAKLDKIAETLEKNRSVLAQINQNTCLSETSKAIAFRDADRQTLRQAVFEKLQQKDFNTAYEMIDEIGQSSIYRELVKELRMEADRYRQASDQERVNQVIAQIEKLFAGYQWAKASVLIERLIKAEPDSEKAREMRQRLIERKEARKKELLATWDEAVKREQTDRGLEILRELDLYLTANEGLALQEAARSVFRNKLHSLGVQFSLAVSERDWAKAFETGHQIVRDFPNSRMAEEIRARWDILKQRAKEKAG